MRQRFCHMSAGDIEAWTFVLRRVADDMITSIAKLLPSSLRCPVRRQILLLKLCKPLEQSSPGKLCPSSNTKAPTHRTNSREGCATLLYYPGQATPSAS
ncbi:hypothetical protein BAUCODRAFT_374841 [Baudoinia panamericana UAMH 10762]|uniref:Uncharacterized protein n=1 Tax=Baudoinia panamericana (strain UAMH 10762) TaxID=717646 RepID=M2NGZ2_BAUPA|nr:uncharacterized protein BAUCODRAFT_374841 [Baudoinia panamericana UAMH 10762]EMC98584.1 hypothetical protein BAUCODRAFT_374841 [Baudoinia panamericana UAMH 10762]